MHKQQVGEGKTTNSGGWGPQLKQRLNKDMQGKHDTPYSTLMSDLYIRQECLNIKPVIRKPRLRKGRRHASNCQDIIHGVEGSILNLLNIRDGSPPGQSTQKIARRRHHLLIRLSIDWCAHSDARDLLVTTFPLETCENALSK